MTTRGSRRRPFLLGLTATAALMFSAAGGASGAEPNASLIGRPLRLNTAANQPIMQPVNAPAKLTRVAVVPGGKDGEAWATGFTHAPSAGFERFNGNQSVFLHYTRATGWQVADAPRRSDRTVFNPIINALALAPNGEGWAATRSGQLIHHVAGTNDWLLDNAASALTANALDAIALGQDDQGVFGYATGAGLTFLRLSGGAWTVDGGGGGKVGVGTVPEMVAVAPVSRDVAWAVSGTNSSSLQIYQRTGPQLWTRVLTGSNMFDAPPAMAGSSPQSQTINQSAHGNAVAFADGVVWISGAISPVNAVQPLANDRSQPFVIRLVPSATTAQITSYCPRLYQLAASRTTSTVEVCNESFPSANGDDLPVLAAFSDGTVLAGGLGFYRLDPKGGGSHGVWARLPNVVGYMVGGSFSGPDEGWVNADGVTQSGSRGGFDSNSPTFGHWTVKPETSSLRRWPQPGRQPYEAVAVDPASSGAALAVGQGGVVARNEPGIGWDSMVSPTTSALHAIAWPAHGRAWAVGAAGAIASFDGMRWTVDPASGVATKKSLYGIAFRSPTDGYAVGTGGTILHYDGKTWTADAASGTATTKRLLTATVAGADVIAAGDKATLLTNSGGSWKAVTGLDAILKTDTDNHLPNLIASAGLPDGTAFVAGSEGTLLQRDPGGTFAPSKWPSLDGDIHALAAAKPGGKLQLLALVGTKTNRFGVDDLTEPYGWAYAGGPSGWRDIGFDRVRTLQAAYDTAALHDPAYGVSFDPSGRAGWIVGGQSAAYSDDDGHARFAATSSVWRVDLDHAPAAAPGETSVARIPTPSGDSFAFLGGTACGANSCAALMGDGNRGDAIATAALLAIKRQVAAGNVGFAAFGGNARVNGLPDELRPMRGLFDDLGVPVYSALGDRDLFGTLVSGPTQSNGVVTSNGYALQAFADRPGPWGAGQAPHGFQTVNLGATPASGQARTHYAVDYAPNGKKLIRLVVLDTSFGGLTASDPFQNPAETQLTWLQSVLADATLQKVPSVVMLNQPIVLPVDSSSVDAASLTSALTAGSASAVVAARVGANQIVNSPSDVAPAFPVGVSGTAGGPLANEYKPTLGAYFAWMLVTVDDAHAGLTGKAPVTIQSIPVLESIALHEKDGRAVGAGNVLHFDAVGRAPDYGGANKDGTAPAATEGNATYLAFPFPRVCGALEQPNQNSCRPANVAVPQYRFVSENANIGVFVAEDAAHPGAPQLVNGHIVPDEHSGLFCAVNPGSTFVRVEAGEVASRLPVTVGGGAGPCRVGTAVVPAALAAPVVAPAEVQAQAPGTLTHEPVHNPIAKPRVPPVAAVGVAVPPLPSATPAPPSGGAAEKKEEQAASEKADARALPPARTVVDRRVHDAQTGPLGNLMVMAMATSALAAFAGIAARRRARPTLAYQYVRTTDVSTRRSNP